MGLVGRGVGLVGGGGGLWCDHTNEISSAALSVFYKMKFGIFLKF